MRRSVHPVLECWDKQRRSRIATGSGQCSGGHMSDTAGEFERLLGHAALRLWPDLPRDVQELLFETAVPTDPTIRNRLAVFLHDRHPRTAHPPKPTQLG